MASVADLSQLIALVGSGLVAGLCFSFWAFLMRAFDVLGPRDAARVMQSLNREILRSAAMFVWFATLAAGVLATILGDDRWPVGLATLVYAVAALGITRFGNVPLNDRLDAADPEAPEIAEEWSNYLRAWGAWNALRTVVLVAATVGFAIA